MSCICVCLLSLFVFVFRSCDLQSQFSSSNCFPQVNKPMFGIMFSLRNIRRFVILRGLLFQLFNVTLHAKEEEEELLKILLDYTLLAFTSWFDRVGGCA